jgi:hypothetical protein
MENFRVVIVNGPRQSGKSTLVELLHQRLGCPFATRSCSATVDHDFRHLRWLRDQLGDRFMNGVVLHFGARTLPAGDRLTSMPLAALWGT